MNSQLYFIETRSEQQRIVLCGKVEQFYLEGMRVHVITDSTQGARHIDSLLWTFSDQSFIPHSMFLAAGNKPVEPVVITAGEVFLDDFPVLICDIPARLEFISRYPISVVFVLLDDQEKRQESRLMWQSAKDMGLRVRHEAYSLSGRHGGRVPADDRQ